MRTPEERLRDALAASAALVQPEEHPASLPVTERPRHPTRWLVPIAVAITVLALTLAGVFLTHRQRTAPATPTHVPTTRFFVADETEPANAGMHVRDIRTGQITQAVPPPKNFGWISVSATANPLVFYLTAESNDILHGLLVRLTITGEGHIRSEVRVASPRSGYNDLEGLAVSPDGTRYAEPIINPGRGTAEIDVATPTDRTRQAVVYKSSTRGMVSNLSWSADGRYLAFELDGMTDRPTVRILDTRAGRDLIADSRQIPWTSSYSAPLISPDGNGLYMFSGRRIREIDLRTGRQLRTLTVPSHPHPTFVWTRVTTSLTRDPTGGFLLAVDGTGYLHIIDLSTGTTTAVPFGGSKDIGSLAW